MRSREFTNESPARELAKKLPTLAKHDYDTIDKLMQKIAKKHRITGKKLHKLFVNKYHKIPDDWIKDKLSEMQVECDLASEVEKATKWASKLLKLENIPKVHLSMDTEEAQEHHHTGRHIVGDDTIWVYAKNRNLVDILRTVFHELRHVKQEEEGKVKHNSSYPGSPIERDADVWAGKYIKIYGEKNRHIFQ